MTEQGFQTHLEQSPDDWEMRLVYADWLEERRESIRANGQRWQVENGKRPDKGWDWWRMEFGNRFMACLDKEVYEKLDTSWAEYEHLTDADKDLASALHKLGIVSNCNSVTQPVI